ncbi:hypothetical protein [Candidiatus Paracoxiella cheracis]|uniref:hypothetical protein n=1 Tax=Candidiatus Paracoxiella cheracis TaxID=3405120 RepID=UPI003BF50EF4
MPSYTSNFKAKYKILLFFLTVLVFFLLSNFAIYHHFFGHTTKDYYINNMPSKEKHMALNLKNSPQKDAILIGNSRTLFQISTINMHEHGLNVYNLGISGHESSDFPSMINHALRYKPKAIVLFLAVSSFHAGLDQMRDVDWDDIQAYIKSDQSAAYITKSLLAYFKTWFLINNYSTNINIRIRTAYKSFDSYSFLDMKHIKKAFRNQLFNQDKHFVFNKELVKCKIFRMAYPKKLRAIGMCTNGDGILAGSASTEDPYRNEPMSKLIQIYKLDEPLNQSKLKLIDYLIDKIKKHGVKPIIVFTPIFENPYPLSYRQQTKAKIPAPVIDLTNYRFPHSYWADRNHLNFKGRHVYTNVLVKCLKQILD